MQVIDVCLIEKDSVCREKIIIASFLRLLQRIKNKNREVEKAVKIYKH